MARGNMFFVLIAAILLLDRFRAPESSLHADTATRPSHLMSRSCKTECWNTTMKPSAGRRGELPRSPSKGQMDTLSVNRSQITKRRSSRVALNTRIGLSGQDRQKCSFTMPARATNLNKHGAAVQLNRELLVGSIVVVQNKRGTQVSARVVAQLGARQGVPSYGIEFVEQNDRAKNFWGIAFPSNG